MSPAELDAAVLRHVKRAVTQGHTEKVTDPSAVARLSALLSTPEDERKAS